MTPFLAEEARPRTLEDPSPTLMITDVLGDLAAEVEVAESLEAERQEKGRAQHLKTVSEKMSGTSRKTVQSCLESPLRDQLESKANCKSKNELKHTCRAKDNDNEKVPMAIEIEDDVQVTTSANSPDSSTDFASSAPNFSTKTSIAYVSG